MLIETFFDDLMVVVFFFGLKTPYFAIDIDIIIIIMILNINKSIITFMVFRTFLENALDRWLKELLIVSFAFNRRKLSTVQQIDAFTKMVRH